MTSPSRHVVLLGPQAHRPTVSSALRSLPGVDPRAPVAIVSAGWEEREREHEEFEQHIEGRAVNLEIYHGVEEIYQRDPGFRELVLERHDRHHALQDLYRARLGHALQAARELYDQDGQEWLLEPERAQAVETVRALDVHHVARAQAIQDEFRAAHRPAEHGLVGALRERLARQIADCSVLCIAGGNVSILLNRLRIAGLLQLWTELPGARPIVAWGAGAMVISDRIVLFHDSPPQGAGNAEVLEPGFGLAPGIVPLPHANHRLRLEDTRRVSLFARRFAPARCVALDDGARADVNGATWTVAAGTRTLEPSGELAISAEVDA